MKVFAIFSSTNSDSCSLKFPVMNDRIVGTREWHGAPNGTDEKDTRHGRLPMGLPKILTLGSMPWRIQK